MPCGSQVDRGLERRPTVADAARGDFRDVRSVARQVWLARVTDRETVERGAPNAARPVGPVRGDTASGRRSEEKRRRLPSCRRAEGES
jgi:hypothetical protein